MNRIWCVYSLELILRCMNMLTFRTHTKIKAENAFMCCKKRVTNGSLVCGGQYQYVFLPV